MRKFSAESAQQATALAPQLSQFSEAVSRVYDVLAKGEIIKVMSEGILKKVSRTTVKELSSKIPTLAHLNSAIASDALNLRAKVEIMASIAGDIDALSG